MLSATTIRRLAIEAQGYASRSRRGTKAEVEATVRRLSCVQLDSISTVERSHRIALGSRVGAYPREAVSALLREGRLYQLVRQGDVVRERTLEVTFLEPGAEAYAFTFG